MKLNTYLSTALSLILFIPSAFAVKSLPILGQEPEQVVIDGSKGGLVADGKAWTSESMQGKLNLFIYVDPDLADANDHFTNRMKQEAFSPEELASVVVINMQATWKPNMIIRSVLAKKQKEFPNTTYVMDKDKVLVEKWQLQDDDYNILLFDADGKVEFRHHGVMPEDKIEEFVKLVRTKLEKSAA